MKSSGIGVWVLISFSASRERVKRHLHRRVHITGPMTLAVRAARSRAQNDLARRKTTDLLPPHREIHLEKHTRSRQTHLCEKVKEGLGASFGIPDFIDMARGVQKSGPSMYVLAERRLARQAGIRCPYRSRTLGPYA